MSERAPIELQTALADLHEAEYGFETFVQENALVIDKYLEYKSRLEESEEKVKKLYTKHADTVGSRFDRFKVVRNRVLDFEKFKKLMDENELDWVPFTQTKISITLGVFDSGVESGMIPEEIASAVVGQGPPSIRDTKRK